MPHKTNRCSKCGVKHKHHRWTEKMANDRFGRGEYWNRETKCPVCGDIGIDRMMRRGYES